MSTVWLGRGVSNNVAFIDALQKQGCSVVLSHHVEQWAGQEYAASFREPDCSGDEYVNWCAEMVSTYGFDYFMPGRCLGDFSNFPAHMTSKLIMGCAPETINDLDDKAIFYQKCRDAEFDFAADFAVFTNAPSFQSGVAMLRAKGHERLCFKPSKGVFGQGFRMLTTKNPLESIVRGSSLALRESDFERWLEESDQDMDEMIVMPLFNGKEISVDGSFDGLNYRMVARQKNGSAGQTIVTTPAIYETAEKIARLFELRGVFNIQLMHHNDRPMVLEVNPRAAGGIGVSLLSGIDVVVPGVFTAGRAVAQGVITPTEERDIVCESRYYERKRTT